MKKCRILQLCLFGMTVGTIHANAGVIGLNDWCVNLNGDIATACNGAGSGGASGTGSISLAGFDTTLSGSGSNNLGTVSITLGAGMNQQAGFYADYDVNYATLGSFQDSATVHGAAPAGVSFEADDPNTSNIFGDFSANTLSNLNNVGTPGGPPTPCCDVSFAIALSGVNVKAGDSEQIDFTVSSTVPSGFYIQQTNFVTGDSIYLSLTQMSCVGPNCGGGPSGVPEPSTFGLGVGVIAGLFAWARRRPA